MIVPPEENLEASGGSIFAKVNERGFVLVVDIVVKCFDLAFGKREISAQAEPCNQ